MGARAVNRPPQRLIGDSRVDFGRRNLPMPQRPLDEVKSQISLKVMCQFDAPSSFTQETPQPFPSQQQLGDNDSQR
jgi:hypothetical protein